MRGCIILRGIIPGVWKILSLSEQKRKREGEGERESAYLRNAFPAVWKSDKLLTADLPRLRDLRFLDTTFRSTASSGISKRGFRTTPNLYHFLLFLFERYLRLKCYRIKQHKFPNIHINN